jgi:WD40 repeat protein
MTAIAAEQVVLNQQIGLEVELPTAQYPASIAEQTAFIGEQIEHYENNFGRALWKTAKYADRVLTAIDTIHQQTDELVPDQKIIEHSEALKPLVETLLFDIKKNRNLNDRQKDEAAVNYQSFQCLQTIATNAEGVRALTISPDNQILISGNWDKTIKFWRLATGEELQTWKVHRAAVTAVAISPDGQTLASGSWDDTVKICDIGKGQLLHNIENRREEASKEIASVVFSRDGKTLYTGTRGGSTYYWDVSTGKKLGTLGSVSTGAAHLAMSVDGNILVGTHIGLLKVWELPECKQRHRRIETHHDCFSLAISPDGKTIFIGDYQGNINLWSSREGSKLGSLRGHASVIEAIAVSPNGRILASGGEDKTIKLWDLTSKTQLCTLEGHSEDVLTLAFSPDSRTLVSGSMDSTIKIWGIPQN